MSEHSDTCMCYKCAPMPDHEIADSAQWWKEQHDKLEAENAALKREIRVPVRLLRSEWPPNESLMPGDPRFDALLENIKREGIRDALVINMEWFVVDGHHRLNAAKLLGIENVHVKIWTTTELIG